MTLPDASESRRYAQQCFFFTLSVKFFQKFHSQIGDCEVFSKNFTVLKIFHIQFECSNPLKMDAKSCYEHEMWQFFRLRQPNNDKMVFRYIIIDENAARRAAKIFETKKFHSRFRAKKKHCWVPNRYTHASEATSSVANSN